MLRDALISGIPLVVREIEVVIGIDVVALEVEEEFETRNLGCSFVEVINGTGKIEDGYQLRVILGRCVRQLEASTLDRCAQSSELRCKLLALAARRRTLYEWEERCAFQPSESPKRRVGRS